MNRVMFFLMCLCMVFLTTAYAVDPPTDPCDPLLDRRVIGHRGDVNNDGLVDISDTIALSNYLNTYYPDFNYLPCANSADVDGSGEIDHYDLLYLIQFLFYGGPNGPIPDLPWPGVFGDGCDQVPGGTEIGCLHCPPDCYPE